MKSETANSASAESGKGTGWVVTQLVLLAAIGLSALQGIFFPAWLDPLRGVSIILGVLIGLVGGIFVAVSTLNLGSSFTVFPRPKPDGTFTQSGLYSVVRHPMYAGVLMVALGWSLLWASVLGLLLTGVLGVFLDQKARREEIWLAHKYSDYNAYRQRVHKLIPWLY